MKRSEVFNVRMEVQESPAKQKRETGALLGMMRDIINTHSQPESEFEAFRVIIVALGDKNDPHLCPLCRPDQGFCCEGHAGSQRPREETDAE